MEKIYKLDSAFSFINNPRGMKKAFPKINSNQKLSGISPIKNYLKKGAWMYWSLKDETGTYTRMMNLNFDNGLFFRNWDISLYINFERKRSILGVLALFCINYFLKFHGNKASIFSTVSA